LLHVTEQLRGEELDARFGSLQLRTGLYEMATGRQDSPQHAV